MRKLVRRAICGLMLSATALGVFVHAGQFPSGPITIVVPYPPGGTTDTLARRVAQGMSEQLGHSVIVENRPGASTAIAAAHVARAPKDGHTLLVASNATLAINPHVGTEAHYSARDSFDYVTLLAAVPNVIVVNKSSPSDSLEDFIQRSKSDDKGVSYGSMGAGTSNHIGMEMLNKALDANLLHVPYKGSAPALSDLMGGHVDAVVDTLVATLPQIRAGNLKGLAILSAKRSSAADDIPTAREAVGVDVDLYSWFGLVLPKGTPEQVISTLNEAVLATLNDPKTKEVLEPVGVELIGSTPSEFKAFVDEQYEMYGKLIKEHEIKL